MPTGRLTEQWSGAPCAWSWEQLDQLPGRAHRGGNTDDHRPVGEVVREQRSAPGGGSPVHRDWAVRRGSLRGHRRRPRRTREARPACAGSRRAASRDRAGGTAAGGVLVERYGFLGGNATAALVMPWM